MSTAIKKVGSQNPPSRAETVKAVSAPLEQDSRKTTVWEAQCGSYGAEVAGTLLVGFDTEYKREGDHNRVLSYQYVADNLAGKKWGRVIIAENGLRLSLSRFLSVAVAHGLTEGHLADWPDKVILVGHFTLADLPAFTDFGSEKYKFDSIRGTFVTIRQDDVVTLWDAQRHKHVVGVTLRDSMLLAPAGQQSLAALGKLVGKEKIVLDEGEIEAMDKLLKEDPEKFDRYAIRDPEICVDAALKMMDLNFQLTGKAEVPPTLSSIGLNYLFKLWKELDINAHAVLGLEVIEEGGWSRARKRRYTRKKIVPVATRHMYESLATECYHGGRNEQYIFGAGHRGVWPDYDLCGAYTTALSIIGVPKWPEVRQTRDADDFQPSTLGYARVRFRFQPGTLFPCFPVRSASGLIFPLTGESFCCAPEIYLATKMGAEVIIENGIILPADMSVRPFEAFVTDCQRRRKSHAKGTFDEQFWKEIGNSLYGKTAQGLHMKRVFDSRTGGRGLLPPSRITNPYFAGYVTSLVRAVLGEILAKLPPSVTVCSATTDGFLSDATEADIRQATSGPLCQMFAQARHRMFGDETILEAKHWIAQPLGWRTRGQATLESFPGEKPVLAKAGIKPPKEIRDKNQQNDWIVDTFINRTPETRQTLKVLRNLPEIHQHGGDLTDKEIIRRVSMDYDFKRRPVNPAMRPVNGVDHLYFETAPWESIEEFTSCREKWEQWRQSDLGVLKTVEGLSEFNEYSALDLSDTGLKGSKKSPALTVAKRMFLRAYVRSECDLDAKAMSYAELANWLTTSGYPTKKEDVENAKRQDAKMVFNVVPKTDAVEKFFAAVKSRLTEFDASRLIRAESTRQKKSVLDTIRV